MILKERLATELSTNRIAKFAEIAIIFSCAIAFITLFKSNDPNSDLYNQLIIWLANIIVLILIWLGSWIRQESLAHFGLDINKLNFRHLLKGFSISLVVFILALAGFALGSIIMFNISGMPASADLSGYDYLKGNLGLFLLAMFGIYIVSSFGEEVIYRGFLITRISELGSNNRLSANIALLVSSIIFGLIHYGWGPMGIVQTGLMGLALGASYLFLRRRLWPLIMAHIYLDTMLIAPIYFQ